MSCYTQALFVLPGRKRQQAPDYCIFVSNAIAISFTDYFENADNLLMHHFYGRVKIESSFVDVFQEGNLVQQMLHNLKYKGMRAVGTDPGTIATDRMLSSGFTKGITAIVPVPMHVVKNAERLQSKWGYSQKMSEQLNLPMLNQVLIKIKSTVLRPKGPTGTIGEYRWKFLCVKMNSSFRANMFCW